MGSNHISIYVISALLFGRVSTHLFSNEKPKYTVEYGGGVKMKFYSNFSNYPDHSFKSIYVDISGTGDTVASGGSSVFSLQDTSHFGNRLTVYINKDLEKDPTGNVVAFNLQIYDVNFGDNINFTANIIYTVDGSTTPKHGLSVIELEVLGGPLKCGDKLPATSDMKIDGTSKTSIVLCGSPIPTVTWHHGIMNYRTTTIKKVGTSKYNFSFSLPTVTSDMCGTNLTYLATGRNGIDIEERTKLNILFKPSVDFNLNYRINTSCLRLEWVPVNIGTCVGLVYHIQYLNVSGLPILSTNHSHPLSVYTHCEKNITHIKDTRIRASFNGEVGEWSKEIVALFAPTTEPPTPATGAQQSSDDDDWEIGAIVGGVIGGIILILIIILIIWCCCWAWCLACCCCCCCCKDKEKKESVDGTPVNSLGFQYKKNSKKNKNQVVVVANPNPPNDPAVVYATAQKSHVPNEIQFFDPTEFGMNHDNPSSQYNNTTYIDDDDDDFANKPSVLI